MTGFGDIHPLPGVWDSAHLDTAITLPIGVEAYAAIALRAWLTSSDAVSARTRAFARWSAISALVLGAIGQIAYHLLQEAHITRAPWSVTMLVSSLPVMVLGAGTALAHMLRADAATAYEDQESRIIDEALPEAGLEGKRCSEASGRSCGVDEAGQRSAEEPVLPGDGTDVDNELVNRRSDQATAAAAELLAGGRRVSRRTLRAAGVRGSNAELNLLAQRIRGSAA